ncbi:hypothetical protein [Campylobacter corcagiensis]|nr:hypothetical protein [Campylobacter corcagiensis]
MRVISFILKYKNALNIVGVILSIVYLVYLMLQISVKDSEIKELKFDLATARFELFRCDKSLELQNEAIKRLEIKGELKEPKSVEKIKKIYVKDKSCQGELNAYKSLFNTSD